MRAAGKPAKLGELLGSVASEGDNVGLEHLPEILGEKMPNMPFNRVGKYRLVNALKQRFGPGFRNVPMVTKIISEFEQRMNDENIIRMNKKGRM